MVLVYVQYNATDEYHCKIRYWCTYSTMLLMSTIVKYVEYNATDEYHCKIRYWCTYSTMLLMSTIVKYGTGVRTVQCY